MTCDSSHAIMFRVGNVEIADNNERPIDLMGDFHLFPRASTLLWDSLNSAAQVAISEWCGMHEEIMLRNRSLTAYSATDNSDLDEQQLSRLLYVLMSELDGLFNTLWLWRDHSVSVLPGWSLNTTTNQFLKLSFALVTSKCDGTTVTVAFPREEIERAAALNHQLFPWKSTRSNSSEIVHVEQHRLGRALRFVRAARGTAGLSVKLANYTFAMESLLSWHAPYPTAKKERDKSRISRIVRSLVSHSSETDQTVTNAVKDMFKARDKVAHGQVFGLREVECLGEAVQNADYLLRIGCDPELTR